MTSAAASMAMVTITPRSRYEHDDPGDACGYDDAAIRINDQRRICVRWREGDAYDVEIVDYR